MVDFAKEVTKIRFEKFADLYPKFVAGKKWLDQRQAKGVDVQKDSDDFVANVAMPLSQLYESLSPEEKVITDRLIATYEKFGGKRIKFRACPALRKAA